MKIEMEMIKITENGNEVMLEFTLPQNLTQCGLIALMNKELNSLLKVGVTFGKDVKISGRITTGMCLWLGHKLAHICKSVSIFVPQEDIFLTVIKH